MKDFHASIIFNFHNFCGLSVQIVIYMVIRIYDIKKGWFTTKYWKKPHACLPRSQNNFLLALTNACFKRFSVWHNESGQFRILIITRFTSLILINIIILNSSTEIIQLLLNFNFHVVPWFVGSNSYLHRQARLS